MRLLPALAVMTSILAAAVPAAASDYGFTLFNKAHGYTINGFYTYQNGRWSANWLSSKIQPGESVPMDWNSNEGDCVVPFRVSWDNYGSDDYKLDWCKGITNIYMLDKGFRWD